MYSMVCRTIYLNNHVCVCACVCVFILHHPSSLRCHRQLKLMMTSSNGNIFRVTGLLCGEFTGPGEFPTQRSVTRSFDVFFDLRPNKQLSKQPWGWWFETPSCSLWRRCNVLLVKDHYCNVIMGAMASQIAASRLFTQLFILAQIKENIKVPRHWPLSWEFTFLARMASNAKMFSFDDVTILYTRKTTSLCASTNRYNAHGITHADFTDSSNSQWQVENNHTFSQVSCLNRCYYLQKHSSG